VLKLFGIELGDSRFYSSLRIMSVMSDVIKLCL